MRNIQMSRNVHILIVNLTGSTVFEAKNITISASQAFEIFTQAWAEGMHILMLENKNMRVNKRFIINKN